MGELYVMWILSPQKLLFNTQWNWGSNVGFKVIFI